MKIAEYILRGICVVFALSALLGFAHGFSISLLFFCVLEIVYALEHYRNNQKKQACLYFLVGLFVATTVVSVLLAR